MVINPPYNLDEHPKWRYLRRPVVRKIEGLAGECQARLESSDCYADIHVPTMQEVARLKPRLGTSPERWERALFLHARVLVDEYSGSSIEIRKWILAALQYLCLSEDVIPDYSIEDGYFDDAIAINYALDEIKKIDRDVRKRIEHKIIRLIKPMPEDPDEYCNATGFRFVRSRHQVRAMVSRQAAYQEFIAGVIGGRIE
jgi:uncharacterized membrane protein YkvA (DUF1232 family)